MVGASSTLLYRFGVKKRPPTILRLLGYGAIGTAAISLVGCSYSYPLDVSFSNGQIVFSAEKKSSGCLDFLEVKSATGEVMWAFDGPLRLSDCKSDLPLVYGRVPAGVKLSQSAKKLKPNEKYYVAASDGDSYYGSFRIRQVMVIDSDPEGGRSGPYFKGDLTNETMSPVNSR